MLWIVGPTSPVRAALASAAKDQGLLTTVRDDVPLQHWYLTSSRTRMANRSLVDVDISPDDSVIALLGLLRSPTRGYLAASAAAITAAEPRRIVWVNRLGIGFSKRAVPAPAHWLLTATMARSLADRTASDALVLDAGETVLHVHSPSHSGHSRKAHASPLTSTSTRAIPRRTSAEDLADMALELINRRSRGLYLAR